MLKSRSGKASKTPEDSSTLSRKSEGSKLKKTKSSSSNSDASSLSFESEESSCKKSNEQIQEEIRSYKQIKRNFELMSYAIAFYSGFLIFTYYSNLYHVKQNLKKSNIEYTQFFNLTASSWIFKPLYGWISDSFHPFGYRFKSYIVLMTCIHGTFCVICQMNSENFSTFFLSVFVIYFTVAFVDTMGAGMTAIVTTMQNKIHSLTPKD